MRTHVEAPELNEQSRLRRQGSDRCASTSIVVLGPATTSDADSSENGVSRLQWHTAAQQQQFGQILQCDGVGLAARLSAQGQGGLAGRQGREGLAPRRFQVVGSDGRVARQQQRLTAGIDDRDRDLATESPAG